MRRIIVMLMMIFAMTCSCAYAITIEEAETHTGGWIYETREVETQETNAESSGAFCLNLMSASEEEDNSSSVSANDYYGYNTLVAMDTQNNNTRFTNAYKLLVKGLKNRAEEIDFTNYKFTKSEFDMVYRACNNDFPQIFYILYGYSHSKITPSSPYITYVYPSYISYLNTSDHSERFEEYAESIIVSSGVRADMSDYDKAIMLHDELAAMVVYNEEAADAYDLASKISDKDERSAKIREIDNEYGHVHSAYGALVLGNAVCDGYAKAYQYLLYKVGILSHLVTGTVNGGGHAWNLVRLDGKWYYTDLTWDDSKVGIFYSYFNTTEEQSIGSGHLADKPYELPECTEGEHNYFVRNEKTRDTIDADFMAGQLKDGLYARVYITGNADDAWEWASYDGNIASIARKAGIVGQIGVSGGRSGNEIFIKFIYNKLEAFKNMEVEIGSATDKKIRIIQAFYDENGALLKIERTDDIDVKSFDAKRVKINYSSGLDKFKTVKYFVWDSENGIKPLYNMGVAEY